LAGVSPSGYYRWIQAEESRRLREAADEQDYVVVKRHFNNLHKRAGALVIKMQLERIENVVMNHKKIRRIMRNYGLIAQVRQADPYRKVMKAVQEHKTCSNLVSTTGQTRGLYTVHVQKR
jgi:putative transposase